MKSKKSMIGIVGFIDEFNDAVDVFNWLELFNIEIPGGVPYDYGHIWTDVQLSGSDFIKLRIIE